MELSWILTAFRMQGLQTIGLSAVQTGMDNVRNMTGSPIAGLDPHELIDVRPLNYGAQHVLNIIGCASCDELQGCSHHANCQAACVPGLGGAAGMMHAVTAHFGRRPDITTAHLINRSASKCPQAMWQICALCSGAGQVAKVRLCRFKACECRVYWHILPRQLSLPRTSSVSTAVRCALHALQRSTT